jgi:hypothetical protein
LKQAFLCIHHHPLKFFSVFDLGAGYALVSVETHQMVPGALNIFLEELLLHLKAVELVVFIRGNTAVSGYPQEAVVRSGSGGGRGDLLNTLAGLRVDLRPQRLFGPGAFRFKSRSGRTVVAGLSRPQFHVGSLSL